MLVIMAQMARAVPNALPCAEAKNGAIEAVNSFAPPDTA